MPSSRASYSSSGVTPGGDVQADGFVDMACECESHGFLLALGSQSIGAQPELQQPASCGLSHFWLNPL